MTILRLSSCSGEGSVGWYWDRLTALRQGHWEEDVAKGDLPTMPLKRLCCSEGEESEIHPSIPEGSAGGRRAGGATKELFMGPGSRSAKDGA